MKYFAIEYSLNERIVGKIPQTKEFKHHCDVSNDPSFIDKFPFTKIEVNPILSNLVLYPSAKQTDVIDTMSSVGFSFGSLVVSNEFKDILEQFKCYGIQFFSTHIIQDGEVYAGYWQTHIYKLAFEYIDFSKTQIVLRDRDKNRNVITKDLKVSSMIEFFTIAESVVYPKEIRLSDIHFNENMDLDYFQLGYINGGHRGIVSEKLKSELEKQNCTGIEFRPLELPLVEWLQNGE